MPFSQPTRGDQQEQTEEGQLGLLCRDGQRGPRGARADSNHLGPSNIHYLMCHVQPRYGRPVGPKCRRDWCRTGTQELVGER